MRGLSDEVETRQLNSRAESIRNHRQVRANLSNDKDDRKNAVKEIQMPTGGGSEGVCF